jgi:CHASE2 domain-containing sensor protein
MEGKVEVGKGRNAGAPGRTGVSDTSADAERVLIEGYRRMSPAEKLERVFELNHALEQLQRARITADYGDIPEREMRLRLASLRLGRETMVKAFGWDPEEMGW